MPESMSGGKKSFQESSKERTKNSKNPYTVKAQMVGSEANSWSSWLKAVLQGKTPEEKTKAAEHLGHIRSQVLAKAHIRQGDTVLDVGTGTGLLAFGAANQVGSEGQVIGCDIAFDCLQECRSIAGRLTILKGSNLPMEMHVTCRLKMHPSMWCSLALEWFKAVPVPGRPSYYKLLRQKLSEKEVDTYLACFRSQVAGRTVQYRGAVTYLWGKKDI